MVTVRPREAISPAAPSEHANEWASGVRQGEGVFLSASPFGIADVIYMVAGIICFEELVRPVIHSVSVTAR